HLEGGVIACRTMGWFVDREVRTVLLPYASVPELERYCRARGISGILLWENEPELFARATPCGSLADLEGALCTSGGFGPPRVSGAWRWYPLASEVARAGGRGNRLASASDLPIGGRAGTGWRRLAAPILPFFRGLAKHSAPQMTGSQ